MDISLLSMSVPWCFSEAYVVKAVYVRKYMMEIITSQKRNQKLCYEGYLYTRKATKTTRIFWQCSERKIHVQGVNEY